MISRVYFSSYLMLLYQITLRLVAPGTEGLESFSHLGNFQFFRNFVIAVLQLGSCNYMNCVRLARRSFRKKDQGRVILLIPVAFKKIHLQFHLGSEKDPMQYRFWCMYDNCRRTCLKTRNGENGDTVLNSVSVMPNSVLVVYVSLP